MMKFRKAKRCYLLVLAQLLITFVLGMSNVPAEARSLNTNEQIKATNSQLCNNQIDSLVHTIPQFLNNKQYNKFVDATAGDVKASFSDLFLKPNSRENEKNNTGLWNINDIKLLKYKQVQNSQLPSSFVHFEDYSEYNDVVTYYVSFDIIANEDNMDIFSGTNHYIWVFGKDHNGEYKLLQWSQPIIKEMEASKLAYGDGTEDLQMDIQKARKNGVILNGKREQIANNIISKESSYDPDNCPIKSEIRVKRVSLNRIDNVNFYYYVKNVLPNEWVESSDPVESLKAGAMCVKMYGWYHCYYYKYYGQGFDVKDTTADQVYVPDSEQTNCTSAINAVGGIGIENSAGFLFETQYLASGPTQNSGKVSHSGANSLANNDHDWLYICKYYYDNSDKSSGAISSFNY